MSAPETKALPPAPDSTTTRIAGSLAKSARISFAACHISSEVALSRSGLLKIIVPIGPSLRAIILSVGMKRSLLREVDLFLRKKFTTKTPRHQEGYFHARSARLSS